MSEEDLFGSSSEEEEDEEMKEQMKKARERIERKSKEAKSMIVWEIYPEDSEVDLGRVETEVKAIVMDGLSWSEGVKKIPFIFGMFALKIVSTIVDSKIESSEIIEEKLLEIEGVKRVKIAGWDKI